MKSNKPDFEAVFARFIEWIGGELLATGPEESADFMFCRDRIVVELKTLQQDQRDEHVRKLTVLINAWTQKGQLRVYGTPVISLRKMHPEPQREWLHLLEAPIEGIVRKANRQIRSTKNRERMTDAKGLLLIVNDGNLLHTAPLVFMNLVARILQRRTAQGERKYHIRGVVYFSYRISAAGEPNLFWVPGTLEPAADADLQAFQNKVRTEWFAYFARIIGRPITEDARAIPPSF